MATTKDYSERPKKPLPNKTNREVSGAYLASLDQPTVGEAIKHEAVVLSTPLLKQAAEIQVTNPAAFMQADKIRGQIKAIHKALWDRTTALIKPAKESYDGLLAFRREVVESLEKADEFITDKMQAFKRLELIENQRIAREAAAERERLEAEANAKALKAEQAKTPATRTLFTNQALKLVEQAEAAEPVLEVVKGESSGTRTVTKWRVTDKLALMAAIIAGDVPDDVMEVDPVIMGKYFRFEQEAVRQFPGVEVYEDVEIVSKRGGK